MNEITYELTVGEYEDLTVLGTYPTRDEALRALGEYALSLPSHQRVEYPAINEWAQTSWAQWVNPSGDQA